MVAGVSVDSVDWILIKTEQDLEWRRKQDFPTDITFLNYNNYKDQVASLK